MSDAEQQVWDRMPAGTRKALAELPRTDLQSRLLSLARARAAQVKPAELMRRWREDRFVRPSAFDPRKLGDGGFTGWTAQLMNNAKERCLVSCLATERLSALAKI